MVKMVVADDEPIIIAGIQKLMDWNALGIEIVGQYTDGKLALEGIIKHRPDIALLDVSMPEMTGVEILKECYLLEIPSRIIFISGFQDFEYAKAGIQYGAVDYLLKPIIRDELLNALNKCISQLRQEAQHDEQNDKKESIGDYEGLLTLKEGCYLPVYVEIFLQTEENYQMKKLVHFSVVSFIEEYLDQRNQGIVFAINDGIAIIFKEMKQEEGREASINLCKEIRERLGYSLGIIIGNTVDHMSEIPDEFQRCRDLKEYFFFADQMQVPVLVAGEKVFRHNGGKEHFLRVQNHMIDMVIAQDEGNFEKSFEQFVNVLCRRADGKKEDACFYFCSTVRVLHEKFQNLSLVCPDYDEKELLQKGRECRDYRELWITFHQIMQEYYEKLKNTIANNNNKDFLKAKIYIDQHYNETLTLEVLAGEIHMNPYYFSKFFKKCAGENFKDYVNRVRIQHAVSLLVSTDMKAYEIAMRVGFGDAKIFSENFQRIYHETPNAYRKRAKQTEDK